MQAQQSNTASGPGKTNSSFFASIRAAAAAQQPIASPPPLIAAPKGLEAPATAAANVISPPQDLERNDETTQQLRAGASSSLNNQSANQTSWDALDELQTATPMSARPGRRIRIEEEPSAREVLSRLISSASTNPMWRNPGPLESALQRRIHPDHPNFVTDSRSGYGKLGYGKSTQSGIQAIDDHSPVHSDTSTTRSARQDLKPSPEGLTVIQSEQSTLRLQRERSVRAGLAHDAKSLLAALKLYSELLAVPGVLSEQHGHYANDLNSLANRSLDLIERLLPLEGTTNTERPITQGETIGRSGTSLVDVLTNSRTLLQTLAAGALEINFGAQAAQPILVSAESMERILVNLINNAARATQERGAIRIRVRVEPRLIPPLREVGPQPSEMMVLSVDDSGCGMTEQQIKELSHEQTTLPGQQHGIGLQVVRNLVSASGGTLELQSRLGVGTRVEIRWPLAVGAANDGHLRDGELSGHPFAGVVGHMEMIADPMPAPDPDRVASPRNPTHMIRPAEELFSDEQTSRWSDGRRAAAPEAVDGWRAAIQNIRVASTSAPAHPSDRAKSATHAQGVIAC